MNKPNRKKPAETDLMDMKLVPLSEVAEGFCRHRKNNGEPCKRRAVVMGVCPSHLRSKSVGGHIFETDRYDPEFTGWGQKKDFSYCRACGEPESNGRARELCPVRRVDPSVQYPPSPKLPNRLQYKFAKPIRETITVKGTQTVATCCGPFAAYRIEPDAAGFTWEIFHVPSRRKVVHLDSETASIKVMREICHEGVDLDFKDPMTMSRWPRHYINMALNDHDRGKLARERGGILAWTAAKPYFQTGKETNFYWAREQEKIECWGSFGFQAKGTETCLYSLDEPGGWLFVAPSREQAIVFAKAATALNLNWKRVGVRQEGFYTQVYEPEALAGIKKLISEFRNVIRWRDDLLPAAPPPPQPPPKALPELPSHPDLKPVEIFITTREGPWKVSAYVVAEHFAIHRPPDSREDGCVLTHAPTGYKIGQSNDIEACLTAALRLKPLADWSFANPILACLSIMPQAAKALRILNRCGVTKTHSNAPPARIM